MSAAAEPLLETPLFKAFLERIAKIYCSLSKPLLGIKSINLITGEAEIYHFG